ncbi:MAG: polysaccharide pyruvyl transferase family protein [Oxalobacteraceae bacterium]|nr:MAG: polysaccharide pyruvyl transferase family protein [Oxalobacteraceae bacterium]
MAKKVLPAPMFKLAKELAGKKAVVPIMPNVAPFGPYSNFDATQSEAIPVSTVAPFHNSIGDISTGQVTQNFLSIDGIPSYSTSFWDTNHKTIVIGGGEIIGFPARGAWSKLKPLFLPNGNHILNAIGFDIGTGTETDLGVLGDYKYVSVRDHLIAEQFHKYAPGLAVVPCPATLQYGIPLPLIKALPRFEFLRPLEEDNYIVVHRHPKMEPIAKRLRKLGHRLVIVDMQAHAKHPWRNSNDFIVPPGLHSPELIQGLVNSAHAIVTVSLHLAIFSIGANKPFAAVSDATAQSAKVKRYLTRAGIESVLAKKDDDLFSLALENRFKLSAVSASEKAKTLQHLQNVAKAARAMR